MSRFVYNNVKYPCISDVMAESDSIRGISLTGEGNI